MLTIAQCVWSYYPFVADQICNLKRYQSVIFSLRKGYVQTILQQYMGLPVYASHCSENSYLQLLLNRLTNKVWGIPWSLNKAAQKHQPVLLHAHMGDTGIDFLPLARKLGLPLLVSFHGSDAYALPSKIQNRIALRLLFEKGDLFLVVSNHMKNRLLELGCPEDKILIHRVGVDVNKFVYKLRECENRSEVKILCVANFVENKGLPNLIHAFSKAKEKFQNVQLKIVGGVCSKQGLLEKEKFISLIRDFNLENHVILAGHKDHSVIHEEYQDADIFVLPSITVSSGGCEGVPTVLMEAQSCGLPVVSTCLSGIPEVVIDGKSGYLVPEKDIGSLTQAIVKLLENPRVWGNMGKCGRQHIENEFNLSIQIHKLEEIYDHLALRYN